MVRELVASTTPYELRKAGLENDLIQLAAVDRLPFESVKCPTLIAHGTADGDVPYADAEHAAHEIANAELHTLDGGWHLLNLSDGAAEFEKRQVQFLDDHVKAEATP